MRGGSWQIRNDVRLGSDALPNRRTQVVVAATGDTRSVLVHNDGPEPVAVAAAGETPGSNKIADVGPGETIQVDATGGKGLQIQWLTGQNASLASGYWEVID